VACRKASLQEEVDGCDDANRRYAFVSFLNAAAEAAAVGAVGSGRGGNPQSRGEWVRVVSLAKSAALRREAAASAAADTTGPGLMVGAQPSAAVDYSVGRLVRILDVPVSLPASGNSSEGSLANNNGAAGGNTVPLVELWRQAGFDYSDAQAARTVQVLVEFPSAARPASEPLPQFAYPADKVFRTRAPVSPDPAEVQLINASLADGWAEALVRSAALQEVSQPGPLGDTHGERVEVNVRNGFVASPGFVLLAADYSQVELRILAHFAADPHLTGAFEAGTDVFRTMAARWLGRGADCDVSDAERSQAKQICYALIYGAGPSLVAQQAGVTVEAAQGMMKDFLRSFPGVQRFLLRVKKQCRREGHVQTLLGRRRWLPDISSADPKSRARAERQAVNTLCQGSAADLIKVSDLSAMVGSYMHPILPCTHYCF
jgi:hypothetical protein